MNSDNKLYFRFLCGDPVIEELILGEKTGDTHFVNKSHEQTKVNNEGIQPSGIICASVT